MKRDREWKKGIVRIDAKGAGTTGEGSGAVGMNVPVPKEGQAVAAMSTEIGAAGIVIGAAGATAGAGGIGEIGRTGIAGRENTGETGIGGTAEGIVVDAIGAGTGISAGTPSIPARKGRRSWRRDRRPLRCPPS